MIIYDIKLYDARTDTVTIVISLPERRQNSERPRGRMTIEKWARSLLGEDWWLKNWHNISIAQSHHNHLRRDIGKSKILQPPKKGGVD